MNLETKLFSVKCGHAAALRRRRGDNHRAGDHRFIRHHDRR